MKRTASVVRRHGAQAALHGGELAQAVIRIHDEQRLAGRADAGANAFRLVRPAPRSPARSAARNRPIRRSRKVSPRNSSSALGDPMRRDSPAARMSPATLTSAARAQRFVGEHRLRKRAPVRLRVAAHGDHLRHHRNGDLFRRDRADLQAHGREDALERCRAECLPFPVP